MFLVYLESERERERERNRERRVAVKMRELVGDLAAKEEDEEEFGGKKVWYRLR